MRGMDEQTGSLFSDRSPESMVPSDHPLRVIRSVVNAALERLSAEFSQLYSPYGRASIAPEKLLRALLMQAFFGVRSERQLMEQVRYNTLFRWFIGLSMDAPVWDVTVFTKNRGVPCGFACSMPTRRLSQQRDGFQVSTSAVVLSLFPDDSNVYGLTPT